MLKEHSPHLVTITQEEHAELCECRTILSELVMNNWLVENNVYSWDLTRDMRFRIEKLFDINQD